MKKPIQVVLLAALLAACGSTNPAGRATDTPKPRQLNVFAAASLTDAFTEMGRAFEKAHPGVTISFNFAGSQTLSTQLSEGATADVFASANHAEMDKITAEGLASADAPRDFATNQLVVILPAGNPAKIKNLQDLARGGLKLVLADATVPAGKYARQSLDKLSADPAYGADFGPRVLQNVVSNETDVKQVVAKVQLNEADAGIVYHSDAVAAPELPTIEIPKDFNVVAKYPITVLRAAAEAGLGEDFVGYVLSPEGQATLKKWGFAPVVP